MSKLVKLSLFLMCSSALLAGCDNAAKDTHPQKLLSQRQAIFKKMTKTLEPLGLVARGRKDYVRGEFAEGAQTLKDLSSQPWVFFSADGNYPPTRAKPEVWSQPEKFKQAQTDFQATVDKLVVVSGSADLPAVSQAVDAVQKSCKSCHDQFRNER
jgi:cytochrome c556